MSWRGDWAPAIVILRGTRRTLPASNQKASIWPVRRPKKGPSDWLPAATATTVTYGVDNPNHNDLWNGQVAFNQTFYTNLIWDYTKQLRFGLEFTWRETDYILLNDNDGVGLHFQTMYRF